MSSSEIVLGKAVVDAYNIAEREGWIKNFLDVFRKKHRVLVLGSSGAGKTQLIRSLTSLVPELVTVLQRTQFVEKNKLEVNNELFEFIEAPGEIAKFEIRGSAIKDARDNAHGLILNVVADGYHEYSEANIPELEGFDGRASERYLDIHREIEIELLSEWCHRLSQDEKKPRVVTVISKADLWWSDRESIVSFYKNGEYSRVINGFGFDHAIVCYCSRIHKIHGIGLLDSHFDETTKEVLRGHLFQTIFSGLNISKGSF